MRRDPTRVVSYCSVTFFRTIQNRHFSFGISLGGVTKNVCNGEQNDCGMREGEGGERGEECSLAICVCLKLS